MIRSPLSVTNEISYTTKGLSKKELPSYLTDAVYMNGMADIGSTDN